jgi:hypothetical protein
MKSCPKCRQVFSDEYSFCLTDGTPLIGAGAYTEEPTVVIDRPARGRSKGRSLLIFVLAALLAFSLGTTAAVLYFFWPRRTEVSQIPTNTANATPSPSASVPSPSPSPSATPRASKTPTPSAEETPPEQVDPEVPISPDPGPTRIAFLPGRIEQTVPGTVNDRRSYFLYAHDGQTLSARLSSRQDCAIFDSGDTSVRYTTQTGNNSLTVVNQCDQPVRFSLSVTIR